MDEKELEKINGNLEEIWHRLDTIQYYFGELYQNGFLGGEVEDAIIAIGRSLNKDLDKKYREFENMKPVKV